MIRSWLPVFLSSLVAGVSLAGPCPAIEGLAPLVAPGRILVLGELHGTEESPAFALDVACHAADAGLPVVVGLELLQEEQGRVDAFLDSKGTVDDRQALLSGRIWQRDYQDGRNSSAMAGLIEGVRRLRVDGSSVRVALFDVSSARGGQARDRAMGANLVEIAKAAPEAMLIVLAGNMHTRTTVGNPRNPEYVPMGHVLLKGTSSERVVSLNVAHGGGDAWLCTPECGVTSLSGRQGDSRWSIEIDDATRPAGHQGWYRVGSITASPPAARSDLLRATTSAAPETSGASVRSSPPEAVPTSGPVSKSDENRPPSEIETRIQGDWQAYDFKANFKTWKINFDEHRFHAGEGTEDWYKGSIQLRPDETPAQIDFAIEDCRCSYVDMTSQGIYYWEGDSLVIAAPQPGSSRPTGFEKRSGKMMRLRKLGGE